VDSSPRRPRARVQRSAWSGEIVSVDDENVIARVNGDAHDVPEDPAIGQRLGPERIDLEGGSLGRLRGAERSRRCQGSREKQLARRLHRPVSLLKVRWRTLRLRLTDARGQALVGWDTLAWLSFEGTARNYSA
jgi:hypothetical protein